ncbi:MAG: hypothetical protein V1886_00565 [archaeon]
MEKIYKFGKTGICNKRREKMTAAGRKMRLSYSAVLFLAVLLILNVSFVQAAYKPPYHIANPLTKECQYYFAGEQDCFDACMDECQGAGYNNSYCSDPCANQYCHYNLRPAGFDVDIAPLSVIQNKTEACNLWLNCVNQNREWDSETGKCGKKIAGEKQEISMISIIILSVSLAALVAVVLIYLKTRKIQKEMQVNPQKDRGDKK